MERVRFTVSCEPEVHEAFTRMAEAAGQSLSRVVGDWLKDTSESALFVSQKLEQMRRAPAAALGELAVFQRRAADQLRQSAFESATLSEDLASGRVSVAPDSATVGARAGAKRPQPPSSPTGVKTPRTGRRA